MYKTFKKRMAFSKKPQTEEERVSEDLDRGLTFYVRKGAAYFFGLVSPAIHQSHRHKSGRASNR